MLLVGIAVVAGSAAAVYSRVGVVAVIVLAVIAASVLFTLRRGFTFVEVVAFLIHFDGLGRGQISLGRLVSGVAIVVLLYKLLIERWRPPAIPVRHWLPALALLMWAVASGIWSPQIGAWFIGMGTIGLALAYYSVAGFMVDSHRKVEEFLRAYWYGGIFGATAGVWGLVLGVRSYGLNGDANLFGVFAASMIPLTIYYRRHSPTMRHKVIYTLVLLLVIGGAAGAGSRSGVIGAAAVLFATLIYRPGESIGRRIGVVIPAGVLTVVVAGLLLIVNPNTLERGTSSSGRLDFWKVTIELIKESPVVGHGMNQTRELIPPRLATTPGSTLVYERRTEVSAHNTWLEIASDLGFIGVLIWTAAVIVTVISLLRPRWKQTKELSGFILLMFVPVMAGSMFLPLLNNKLAWSIFGLAGALQVPSWGNRYRGYFAAPLRAPTTGGMERQLAPSGVGQLAPPGWSHSPAGSSMPGVATRPDPHGEDFEASRLARWDLKISQRFRKWIIVGGLVGAIAGGAVAGALPTTHSVSMSMIVLKMDLPPDYPLVPVDRSRIQALQTLILSRAYSVELSKASGVELSPDELASGVTVNRPHFGPYLEIKFTSDDAAKAEAVGPYLLDALDELIAQNREATVPTLEDELRPLEPGQQRWYTGPMYTPLMTEPQPGGEAPRQTWLILVGGTTGAMLAMGYSLLKQRTPRVNNDDDLQAALGLSLWSHVGRPGRRRNAATADQYAQIAMRALDAGTGSEYPRRIVIATPVHDRSARHLAIGIAASIAASGARVVLIDGQPERRLVSLRLGGAFRAGMNDLSHGRARLSDVIHRVRRWRLPRASRRAFSRGRTFGGDSARPSAESLRFVPAGRPRRREEPLVDVRWLSDLDSSVVVVMLAPPLLGTVPVSGVLEWSDVVFYDLEEGATVTFDAEDGALQIATFAAGPSGVVLSDV